MKRIVDIRNIRKTYDGKRYVLNGVNFSLDAGEIATIRGASGCGKSTFLNIVGLLDNYTDGEYYFIGEQILPKKLNTYYNLRAEGIGFIFQSYCLIDKLDVRDNILMPFLYNKERINGNVIKRLKQLLEDLNISHLTDKKAGLLSGGERQRVAICRAMLKKPGLIIADEPTGNLDEKNTDLVVDAINKISAEGTAVIVVTHNKTISFENEKKYTLDGGVLC